MSDGGGVKFVINQAPYFGAPPSGDTRARQLEAELNQARFQIGEYEKVLQTINEEPQRFALVIAVKNGKAVLRCDAGLIEVPVPQSITVGPGSYCRVHPAKFQILDVLDECPLPVGAITTVGEMIGEDCCEVVMGAEKRVVMTAGHKVKPDDRVILDGGNILIIRTLPPVKKQQAWTESPLGWDDIGGCKRAKDELVKAIERPYTHRDIYARYGQKPARGILLYGPPGNGKSLLGRALATSIARSHGVDAGTGFIYVKGPELLNKFIGESEAAVRDLFTRARAHKKLHGYPAVVFIDECDAILGNRDTDLYNNSMARTVVPQFLSEMDGLEDSGAFVLLATNRPAALDPAVVRDGRVDRKLRIDRPDEETARAIFEIAFKGKPVDAGVVDAAIAEVYDDKHKLLEVDRKVGDPVRITLAHTVSGAMIAGVVQRAVERAIDRDVASKKSTKVGRVDVVASIADIYQEAFDVDHSAVVLEVVNRSEIAGIRKVTPK